MGLFSRNKKSAGWMALVPSADGVRACHVIRPPHAMPAVQWLAAYPASHANEPKALEKIARELHAERYQCTTLLNGGEYQLLSVDAPTVPREELKTAIRWRLKDMLDFHVDDATIDVLDVPVEKDAGGRGHSMYAVAARNQVIEQRQTQFLNAGIPLSVIDIPDLAQRNISALFESDGRGMAMLSFDGGGGLLTVTHAGELYLSRRIDVTADQLADEPERAKDHYERITLELQRSLDYVDRQYHFIALPKLLLAPLPEYVSAAQSALAAYLGENLYMPVEALNLDAVLDFSKTPELQAPDVQQRFFLALGAALRFEETVL